eukprot:2009446-Prymnesium_polylepis.1
MSRGDRSHARTRGRAVVRLSVSLSVEVCKGFVGFQGGFILLAIKPKDGRVTKVKLSTSVLKRTALSGALPAGG